MEINISQAGKMWAWSVTETDHRYTRDAGWDTDEVLIKQGMARTIEQASLAALRAGRVHLHNLAEQERWEREYWEQHEAYYSGKEYAQAQAEYDQYLGPDTL